MLLWVKNMQVCQQLKESSTHKAAAFAALAFFSAAVLPSNALSAPELPLMTIDQLEYVGGFRVSDGTFGNSSANNSAGPIAYNPNNHSLFLAGHESDKSIAEFAIPAIVNSETVTDLNISGSPIQNFTEVLRQASISFGINIVVSGMIQVNNKLIINNYDFYDQSPYNSANTLVLNQPNNIASGDVDGYFSMQGGSKAAGWMSPIPADWRADLGGTHISGFSKSTSRANKDSSYGPSAYAFNAGEVANNSGSIGSIGTKPLLYYTIDKTLAPDNDMYNSSRTNTLWTNMSEANFGMIVPGTSTYMVLGSSGGHVSGVSYGEPPYGGYKGYYTNDKYDVYNYYWLYDVNDLVAAKNGLINPVSIKPYKAGEFNAPYQGSLINKVSGGSFDPASGQLYLTISDADKYQGGQSPFPPVIAVFKFSSEFKELASPDSPSDVKAVQVK